MMSNRHRFILMISSVLTLIGLYMFLMQNPLHVTGYTEYDNGKLDIELVNKGYAKIHLREIRVNEKEHVQAQLVLSYSGQQIAGGIDHEPTAQFVALTYVPIYPELTTRQGIEVHYPHDIPTHYGIRLNYAGDIDRITLNYTYMGMPFVKHIQLERWFETARYAQIDYYALGGTYWMGIALVIILALMFIFIISMNALLAKQLQATRDMESAIYRLIDITKENRQNTYNEQ